MSQNLATLNLNAEQLTAVETALTQLETQLGGLVALTTAQRRLAAKMGPKSELFCRQTLSLLEQNPHVVAPSVGLADAQADLQAIDQLRPLFQRLQRLSEKTADTQFALGSDVMVASLKGYALLKLAGRNQGLEALRKSLGERFTRSPRQPEAKAA